MTATYDLTKLGPHTFENLVNFLALKILGNGTNGFGPGSDGGRDGFFEGQAPYPSDVDRWKGVWYIQSKYHEPHLSKDPQKWLLEQIEAEIALFDAPNSRRRWPDNWILATNILPSGVPEVGCFDSARRLIAASHGRSVNFKIWDGQTIINYLAQDADALSYYGHFITPGHVLNELFKNVADERASVEEIAHYLIVTQFAEHTYTKLDQAGSSSDTRPGVHDLFIDLPFIIDGKRKRDVLSALTKATLQCHKYSLRKKYPKNWQGWHQRLQRARVSLIKAGPGQGKSTISQYLCQINRAKLILDENLAVLDSIRSLAEDVRKSAIKEGIWPAVSRIPIQIELKEFAYWYSKRTSEEKSGILNYLAGIIEKRVGVEVLPKTVKRAISSKAWIVVFDGLDEVPNDFKSKVADEVLYFLNDVCINIDADVFSVCTSRPQGYAGQFAALDGPVIVLDFLKIEDAIRCATPVLEYSRSRLEADKSIETLTLASSSASIRELMTTPLQAHIMAVIVRDGGRPPERRWQLFNGFYHTMRKRESMKNFQNPRINKLLLEEDRLLKSVHNRLGFVLHARAETSAGAQTTLKKDEFRKIVTQAVMDLDDLDVNTAVADVMEATTERLVLVSTPEDGDEVRFDIRQLQEFFAAEFLYSGVDAKELGSRVQVIGADAHWREVIHFLMSALIANQRAPDLTYCVHVLTRIDEGDDIKEKKIYAGKSGAAVGIATRLLVEGVVEQDQRDRQYIKSLFTPLGGLFDLNSLSSIRNLTEGTRTRTWIIQNCIDIISSYNTEQYRGAIFLLGIVDCPLDSTDLFIEKFLDLPSVLKDYLIELWVDLDIFDQESKPEKNSLLELHIELAVKTLANSDWHLLSDTSVSTLVEVIKDNFEKSLFVFKKIGFSLKSIDFISRYFLFSESPSGRSIDEGDFGLIFVGEYEANWGNKKTPRGFENVEFDIDLNGNCNYFNFSMLCWGLIVSKNEDDFNHFRGNIEQLGFDKVKKLEEFFLALIPVDLEAISNKNVGKGFMDFNYFSYNSIKPNGSIRPQYANIYPVENRGIGEDDWVSMATAYPGLAVEFLFNSNSLGIRKIFWPEKLIESIKDGTQVCARNILNWGILKNGPGGLLADVKRIASESTLFSFRDSSALIANVSEFDIDPHLDVELLPIFAQAILNLIDSVKSYPAFYDGNKAEDIVKKFDLKKNDLRSIALDISFSRKGRAGALAIYWIMESFEKDAGLSIDESIELYLTLREDSNFVLMTEALMIGCLIYTGPLDPRVAGLVGDLMMQCDYVDGLQEMLTPFVRIWHERSLAPVTSGDFVEKWLKYSFQPPNYFL